MIIDLLNAIKAQLESVDEFKDAAISIAINPRFDPQPEGDLSIIVSPLAVRYEREARDLMKETSVIIVSLSKYFADVFDDSDPYDILKTTTLIELALMMKDYNVNGANYRWETSYANGDPFTDTRQTVLGGMFDVQAADNAFTLQAPIVLQFTRILKLS